MLLLVYTFNFIDRQIIGVLAVPIKAELHLSDTQLGMLGGIAFALFYTALGIPIAWLADRRSRTWIITISLTLWSGFTALCGLATSFWQIFFCRLGVGVGEAGGVAPTHALISDYFPPASRARAIAVYSFGIPLGSASGVLLGGWIASTIDWRAAFITVGIAGVILAPIFRLTVREPARGRYDPPATRTAAPPISTVFKTLATKPSFWLLSFGGAASSTMSYGMMFWLPSFFGRSFGLQLMDLSLFYGAILGVGGIAGAAFGGWLGDRLGAKDRGAYARVPAIAFALAAPCYAIGVLSTSLVPAFFLFLLPQALSLMWLGPVTSAIQHLVPSAMRATTAAIFLFINNIIGLGAGTVVLGALSDSLTEQFGDEALRYAILISLLFYLAASALMFAASKYLSKDWYAQPE